MAAGRSLKKKRKSLLKPYPPMASKSSPLSYTKISILIFLLLASFLIIYLILPSKTLNKLQFSPHSTQVYSAEVVNEFHHDPYAFTQGLLYGGNDTLFESTGLYKRSSVRKVALQTGKVEALHKMDDSHFGEGLTLLGERLFQVTWLTKTGFIYDRNDVSKFETFTHNMRDGWGLANNGEVLFGSDGTSTLYQIDPKSMKVIGEHIVKYKGHEVHNLNELEFIDGEVWANVWQTDCIARISHEDGTVRGWILLNNLRERLPKPGTEEFSVLPKIDVLNGIAWDSQKNRIFVTGKYWPRLFEIKVHPMSRQFEDGAIEDLCLRKPFFA